MAEAFGGDRAGGGLPRADQDPRGGTPRAARRPRRLGRRGCPRRGHDRGLRRHRRPDVAGDPASLRAAVADARGGRHQPQGGDPGGGPARRACPSARSTTLVHKPMTARITSYAHDGLTFDVRDEGPLDGARSCCCTASPSGPQLARRDRAPARGTGCAPSRPTSAATRRAPGRAGAATTGCRCSSTTSSRCSSRSAPRSTWSATTGARPSAGCSPPAAPTCCGAGPPSRCRTRGRSCAPR